MDGVALVGSIVQILVAGLTEIAQGIGEGISALVTNIFLTTDGALSVFGTLIAVFGGISLAIGF